MKIVATVTNVASVTYDDLSFSILDEDPKTGGRND